MSSWVAWLIAAVSTTAFLVLWFWEVRRVLRSRAACRLPPSGRRRAL